MSALTVTAERSLGAAIFNTRPPLDYGVGFRVFTDRRLLGQIWGAISRNVMQPDEIARLENVSTATLIELIEQHVTPAGALREYAAARPAYSVLAWRTSRKHPSKLHILNAGGIALCGTPVGGEPLTVHDGPCSTCAAYTLPAADGGR
jgi:hypothetical protein